MSLKTRVAQAGLELFNSTSGMLGLHECAVVSLMQCSRLNPGLCECQADTYQLSCVSSSFIIIVR